MKKEKKQRRIQVRGETYKPMPITTFRKEWLKKGYELIDITRLCTFKLGYSGWCNDFNEPDEEIYHIQVFYRDENIGVLHQSKEQPNWDDKYVVFVDDDDFIIFRKCLVEEDEKKTNKENKLK